MATTLPFPSIRGGVTPATSDGKHGSESIKINTSRGKDSKEHHDQKHPPTHAKQHHDPHHLHASHKDHHQHRHSPANTDSSVPMRSSTSHHGGTWHHRPRPPNATADSYFPNAAHGNSHDSAAGYANLASHPKTPSGMRGHSRQVSAQGGGGSGGNSLPPSTSTPGTAGRRGSQHMQLSLSTQGRGANGGVEDDAPQGFDAYEHAGPPSPSTLTDIILGVHSTLYGGKRTPEEVRELVSRFYDRDAVFESPLLAAVGHEQIANQFIMAFSLPGMDVSSELRDVICSDFEFDGTRAGIIDQTLSVTLLPSLFGTSKTGSSAQNGSRSAYPNSDQEFYDGGHGADPGTSTPGYTLHSNITPHPFASYSHSHTPAGVGSTFSRYGNSQGHSPTTPYSLSSMWGGNAGTSRPHTPGSQFGSAQVRPFPTSQPAQPHRPSTPPSVNGEVDGESSSEQHGNSSSTVIGKEDESNAVHHLVPHQSQLRMPENAVTPHWSSQGLGRMTVRSFLWGILHPRAVLKNLCTIHLRLMSRLEFNDAGHIVRHEDTWGVREMIEGTIPFASLIYAFERRIVGHICSFAIGRGFRLSTALTHHAIGPNHEEHEDPHEQSSRYRSIEEQNRNAYAMHRPDANEAAHALLLGYNRHNQMMSMARSRASSPTRSRFFGHGPFTTTSTGSAHTSRSRARSVFTGPASAGPARAASSDNLVGIGATMSSSTSFGERERGSTHGGETLPPDSSARYRTGARRITTSTASAPPVGVATGGTPSQGTGSYESNPAWQHGDLSHSSTSYDGSGSSWDAANKTRAPDRDNH